jgi:TolB-like protein/Flp pilus assembly protein TadD
MNPGNFFAELKRRNVYKVAVAYAVVGWLLIQIATQVFPFLDISNWAIRLVILLIATGFPIALLIAWAFELTPEGIKRTEDVDPGTQRVSKNRGWIYVVLSAGVLAIALFFLGRYTGQQTSTTAAAADKSIAVLPFLDLSQAKDQEYFCDGISEEILDALAKVEGLRVVSRTSSFAFKGRNTDVAEIGQKLGVRTVLEGSLRRDGNRIRITAQLINAGDGFHIWSDTFERELQGVFALQDEITRSIVDALKIKLAVAPPQHARPNPEAHDDYLRGLYLSNKSDEESLRQSLTWFERALEKDRNLARAWTGIAKDWLWLADAYVRPLEAYPKVKDAAVRALALDEQDAEAHCYLGEVKRILERNPAGEEAEIGRAFVIDPNSAVVHFFKSIVRAAQGDFESAVKESEAAEKLDPLSPIIVNTAVAHYVAVGRFDEAVTTANRMLQVDPNYLYVSPARALARRAKGDWAEAAAIYEKAQEQTHSPSYGLAITYARMGRTEDARRILDQLIELSRRQYVSADKMAVIHVALNEPDEAFRWLERAFDEHSAPLYSHLCYPDFRPLRADPRFADLLRRMGLDSAIVLERLKPR